MRHRTTVSAAAFALVTLATATPAVALCPGVPITGTAVPELSSFDSRFTNLLTTTGVPGGAVAVVKDGRLVYSRGFGYADLGTCATVEPDALFRIASISKPITALAIMKLTEEGLLDLDDEAFPLLTGITPPPMTTPDPRYQDITIRHLLWHAGGWDRAVFADPMFRSVEAALALGETPPADCTSIIRWMLGYNALNFDPGTQYRYSNLGYCVLGRVIEEVTGQPYETYVKNEVLRPLGIARMEIGGTLLAGRSPDEVRYYDEPIDPLCTSVFDGTPVPCPDGGWSQEALDAGGGWIASTIDLLRLMNAADHRGPNPDLLPIGAMDNMLAPPPPPLSGPPSAGNADETVLENLGLDAHYGMGWDVATPIGGGTPIGWGHGGSLDGTATYLARLPDGVSVVGLFNMRQPGFHTALFSQLVTAVAEVTTWPGHDFFDLLCGNGEVELGESCDDNNTADGDGCSSTCRLMATAAVASSSVGSVEVDPATFDTCGTFTFDDVNYDVFGTPTNLGTAVGAMMFSGNANVPGVQPDSVTPGLLTIDTLGAFVCHPAGCNSGNLNSLIGTVTALSGSVAASLPTTMTFDGSSRFVGVAAVRQCLPGTQPAWLYELRLAMNTARQAEVPLGSYMSVPSILEFSDSSIGALRTIVLDVTFTSIDSPGELLVEPYSNVAGELPSNFITEVGGYRALFFDVSTTATFSGPITICGTYPDDDNDGFIDGTGVPEGAIRILHRAGPTTFDDETSSIDTVNNIVCATVDSLSPFQLGIYLGAPAPMTAKSLRIGDNANTLRRKISFVSRDATVVMAELGTAGDPRCSAVGGGGGSLQVFGTGASGQSATFPLPCENWSLIGRPDSPKGYQYRDREQDQGPCKAVTVKAGKLVRIVCTGKNPASPIPYDLTVGGEGSVAVTLRTGALISYCAELPGAGGSLSRDDDEVFLAKNALAPVECPTP